MHITSLSRKFALFWAYIFHSSYDSKQKSKIPAHKARFCTHFLVLVSSAKCCESYWTCNVFNICFDFSHACNIVVLHTSVVSIFLHIVQLNKIMNPDGILKTKNPQIFVLAWIHPSKKADPNGGSFCNGPRPLKNIGSGLRIRNTAANNFFSKTSRPQPLPSPIKGRLNYLQ